MISQPQREVDALLAQLTFDSPGNGGEVDDPGRGGVQGGETSALRLDFADLVCVNPAQPRDSVGTGAGLQIVEAQQFLLPDGDDQLAAALERNGICSQTRT